MKAPFTIQDKPNLHTLTDSLQFYKDTDDTELLDLNVDFYESMNKHAVKELNEIWQVLNSTEHGMAKKLLEVIKMMPNSKEILYLEAIRRDV